MSRRTDRSVTSKRSANSVACHVARDDISASRRSKREGVSIQSVWHGSGPELSARERMFDHERDMKRTSHSLEDEMHADLMWKFTMDKQARFRQESEQIRLARAAENTTAPEIVGAH